jgi:hypothetical protein
MEEKEPTTDDSIEYLSGSILRSEHSDSSNAGLIDALIDSTASPEEGGSLIRAFIRIKQPELRAAIIKLVTQTADVRPLTIPLQN